jgi:uncharacterized protein (TIGR00730 family)
VSARSRTGNDEIDAQLEQILDELGVVEHRDVITEILVTAVKLAADGADRLNLKITSAALREMRTAFRAFAPYRAIPKVTIFGSARTKSDDPSYVQARTVAHEFAIRDWMVVTGAGPGIMAAGFEGAGRDRSFGVNIRLPFEQAANQYIAGDEKLVSMKYFFTRKLMLIKESRGFVSLPGGFGTMDETYELLTLQQTGKAEPVPIVLLDEPGGSFWKDWLTFTAHDLAGRGLIDDDDLSLFLVTDSAAACVDEIVGFYRNYHSIRWVGNILVIRLEAAPTDEEIAGLQAEFGELCTRGTITRSEPLGPEVTDGDRLDKARIILHFDIFRYGRLRSLINAVNRLPSAPPVPTPPPA